MPSCAKENMSLPNWEERRQEGAYGGIGKKAMAETDKKFRAACEAEDVEPTGRQYSKWARKTGRWSK